MERRPPGSVRDAIVAVLAKKEQATTQEILKDVRKRLGNDVPASSVRSYLRLNTPDRFQRVGRGCYRLKSRA
jgi:hypothetical protein